MKTTEELLKELGEYFRQKVLTGDYVFISCSEYTASIMIDDKYEFQMWIANIMPVNFDFYFTTLNFLVKDHFKLKTLAERRLAYRHMKKHIDFYEKTEMKKTYEKEIERMKKQLDKLNK
jgi:hypothetical protein